MKIGPVGKGALIAGGGLLLLGVASGAAKAGPGADGPKTEPPTSGGGGGVAASYPLQLIKVARTPDTEAYNGAKVRRNVNDGTKDTYRAAIGAVLGSSTGRMLTADGVQFVEFINRTTGKTEYVSRWFVEPATEAELNAQRNTAPDDAEKGFWESAFDWMGRVFAGSSGRGGK